MLKIKAVGHRVIVLADTVERVSKGGIHLAIDVKREAQAAQKGTVVEVGPMAWKNAVYGWPSDDWTAWVKPGDRVYFARYAGKLIRDFKKNDAMLDGKEAIDYFVINDEDVQCLILEEGTEGEIDD